MESWRVRDCPETPPDVFCFLSIEWHLIVHSPALDCINDSLHCTFFSSTHDNIQVQSSAYLYVFALRFSGKESSRSFMCILNSVGKITDPCGTPAWRKQWMIKHLVDSLAVFSPLGHSSSKARSYEIHSSQQAFATERYDQWRFQGEGQAGPDPPSTLSVVIKIIIK